MGCELFALCFDAGEPSRLVRFWSGVLGWNASDDGEGFALLPVDDTGFRLRFAPTDESKSEKNQLHLDLTSTSLEDQQATVDRALELGGRHIDVGQLADEGHVVLADPEGNEFCVVEPGNNFLAGCGFLGAVSCDGSQQVGYFWSGALGWPLVWDRDQETAIRSPHGGPKISWGGVVRPRTERNRLHFDLVPSPDSDQRSEVERLLELGAARLATARHPAIGLADPDGNEFCVLNSRPDDGVGAAL